MCPRPSPLRIPPWWRRHAGVRVRSALAATLIVAVALLAAGLLLMVLLRRSLTQGVDDAATARALDVAAQIAGAELSNSGDAEAAATLREVLAAGGASQSVIQIIGPDGVVAATPEIEGEGPLTDAQPDNGQVVRADVGLPVGEEDTYRVVALGVTADGTTYTVVVGRSLGPVTDSLQTVGSLLAFGFPLLLVVVGAATFWFVGRSLRPVEAIRAQVAGMSGRDLTRRVPVPEARDEVNRLAVTMNGMLDRFESAQRAQRQFVADASHELRSPIATLKASAEVSATHPDLTDHRLLVEGFLAETRRLERLVNDLLLLARVDERGLRPDRREVDLDDLLDAERARVRDRGLDAQMRISAVRALGDPHQLAQAVRNLVDNAMTHAATTVTFSLRRDGPMAIIEIGDDGPGIAAADRERIFDRFVRLDESRERGQGGTGLGLAIVREIVAAHGGEVSVVTTTTGVGATFRIVLPVESPT